MRRPGSRYPRARLPVAVAMTTSKRYVGVCWRLAARPTPAAAVRVLKVGGVVLGGIGIIVGVA